MNKLMKTQKQIEKNVVSAYKGIENGVVSGYHKVEDAVVGGYKKIEDKFVEAFLTPEEEDEQAMEQPQPEVMYEDLEAAIKDRLETGFKNWNGGYACWLEWCNTLYEPDAHYNVYGQRLTMQEYKELMGKFFERYEIKMGDFHNMIIKDDWCAIRYTVYNVDKQTGAEVEQQSMEFVHFKQNPAPLGVRVIEGWATSTAPLSAKA